MLPLQHLAAEHPELLREQFGAESFGLLKRWYKWYFKTQMPSPAEYLFRWFDSIESTARGGGSFNSGLDDFPRRPLKGPAKQLYHVDAQAWMLEFTRVMARLSALFEPEDVPKYERILEGIRREAYARLLDKDHLFKDLLLRNNRSEHSEHLGYITVLPLAFGLIDSDPELQAAAQLLTSRAQLNTTFGLSSLSQDSPLFYESADSYWRGPVWLNVNYLVVRGIRLYYPQLSGLADRLAADLTRNVCGQWA